MNTAFESQIEEPHPVASGVGLHRLVPLSYRSIGAFLLVADLLIIEFCSVLTGTLYHLATFGSYGDTGVFVGTGLVVGYVFVMILYGGGHYRSSRIVGARSQFRRLALIWLLLFLGLSGVVFVLHIGAAFSRGAILSFMIVGCAALLTFRAIFATLMRRAIAAGALRGMRIVYIGQAGAMSGIDRLSELRRYGYRVVQNIVLPVAPVEDADAVAKAILNDVVGFAQANRIDEIILGLRWSSLELIDRVAYGLGRLPIPVRLLPDATMQHLIELPSSEFGASLALEMQRGPLDRYQRSVKRTFDIAVAGVGILTALPILVLVALLVKLDSPGPVFFRQIRTGYGGRPFKIFKFRTMTVMENGDTVHQARRNDARVTRSGRWLRRTSIDELPQLINVLIGNMSIVGPRPHALAHDVEYDRLIGDYGRRFKVKPGITGWAQVNGFRGETTTVDLMMARIECDLWYISNWSLLLDLRTLLKTVKAQLKANNAY